MRSEENVIWKDIERIFESRRNKAKEQSKVREKVEKKEVEKEQEPCEECLVKGSPVAPEGSGDVMFVGMCPGYYEDLKGRPFIGEGGKLLREVLKEIGFRDEDLYFTNVVKCRLVDEAGKNRAPLPREMKTCGWFLLKEIQEIKPRMVVLLGETACKFFFGGSYARYRGMLLNKGDYRFFVTYDPAFLARLGKESGEFRIWKRDLMTVYKLLMGVEEVKVEKRLCRSLGEVRECFGRVNGSFVIDVETWAPNKGGLDPWSEGFKVSTVSFAYKDGDRFVSFCVPLEHEEGRIDGALDEVIKFFRSNRRVIGQNVKFDLKVLSKRFGIDWLEAEFDTMVARPLVSGGRGYSLEKMGMEYLGIRSWKGVVKEQIEREARLEELAEMNMMDCVNTLRLKEVFEEELEKIDEEQRKEGRTWTIKRYCKEVLFPGIKVLKKMEVRGMPVNKKYVEEMRVELEKELKSLEERIFSYKELSGLENRKLSSPFVLNEILFKRFGFEPKGIRKTQAGWAVDKQAVEKLARIYSHPILKDLQDWKVLTKLYSTYVVPYLEEYIRADGRVHGTFNLYTTVTGRLSMENPNLQNLPVRIGPAILSMFQAEEGFVFLVADYSQIELRVLAAYSGDEEMTKAFKNGEDIHRVTASKVFGVPMEEVTEEQRWRAKGVNFGLSYGLTVEGLAEGLGIEESEAREISEMYFNRFRGIRKYMDDRIAEYRRRGFVETLFGRRVYIMGSRGGEGERKSFNSPIQGTASDINQLSLIEIDKEIERRGLRMGSVDVIHDSQIYEVPEEEIELAKRLVVEKMEGLDLDFMRGIPLEVKIGVGKDLWTAKNAEER